MSRSLPIWIRQALRVAIIATIAFGLGPRLVLLQLVALSNNTLVNLEVMPLDQALEKAMSCRDSCDICQIIQQTQNHQNGVPDEAVLADILCPLIPMPPCDVSIHEDSGKFLNCVIDPNSVFFIEPIPPPSPPPRSVA